MAVARLEEAIDEGTQATYSNLLDWNCCEYVCHGDKGKGGLLPLMYWAEITSVEVEAERPIETVATLSPRLANLCTGGIVIEG